MYLKKKNREKLKEMSKRAYGSSSQWKSKLNKPVWLNQKEVLTNRRYKEANYTTLKDVYMEMKEEIDKKANQEKNDESTE